jgi:hypothetical protein
MLSLTLRNVTLFDLFNTSTLQHANNVGNSLQTVQPIAQFHCSIIQQGLQIFQSKILFGEQTQ